MKNVTKMSMVIVATICAQSQVLFAEGIATGSSNSSSNLDNRMYYILSGYSQDSKVATEQLSTDLLNGKITVEQFKDAMTKLEQDKIVNEDK